MTIHPTIVELYLLFLQPNKRRWTNNDIKGKGPYTSRESLLNPGTFIVDPGSYYLRPVKELEEGRKKNEEANKRVQAINRLRNKL